MKLSWLVNKPLGLLGLQLARIEKLPPVQTPVYPRDAEQKEIEIIAAARPFTMTSVPRLLNVIRTVDYLQRWNITGAIVECGVWKGGSMMAAALRLLQHSDQDRELFLYDTFAGMPEPDHNLDKKSYVDRDPLEKWKSLRQDDHNEWCFSPLEEVEQNMASTGYPPARTHLRMGRVEETLPTLAPGSIALLRVDTDWYASTKHILECLYPAITPGGVMILDDYHTWRGAKKAVDEYFAESQTPLYFHRVDKAAVVVVKPLESSPVIQHGPGTEH